MTDEERAELEHRAGVLRARSQAGAARQAVLYAAEGATNAAIAKRLDMNANVVGRSRSRLHAERLNGLEDRARAGRPRGVEPLQDLIGALHSKLLVAELKRQRAARG